MTRREFEELAQRALDGDCSDAELRALEGELMKSRERRNDFRDTFLLHEMLLQEVPSGVSFGWRAKVIPIEAILRRQQFREVRVAVLTAAALIVMAAVVMRVIWTREAPPPLRITAAPHSAFQVTDLAGKPCPPDRIEPGASVGLAEGTLELKLSNDVQAIVQAPARFTFVSPMKLRMDYGAGRFKVPRKARGFMVSTPDIDAVDLGTEFGILNRPGKDPQLHVFKGRVRIKAHRGLRESAEITAGKAVRSNIAGRLEAIPLESRLFYQNLPADLPYVHLPFEMNADGTLAVDGSHPAVGSMVARPTPGSPAPVAGVTGMAAHFDGGRTPVVTDWPGVDGATPRTIAAWIRVAGGKPYQMYQTIAGWGDPTIGMAAKCELLLLRPAPGAPAVLRLSFDQFLFSGTTGLADGGWHHVAATWREDPANELKPVVQLYVDGNPEPLDMEHSVVELDRIHGPRTLTRGEQSMPLVIGYTDRPRSDRGFHGDIDEVMVFEAALDAGRIETLATPPPRQED